ncbi:MAG: DnaJ domain-containing protein [Myxococcota bacterium]|nr:DnaJ domain-containing protein [Myxococcota bacterium]
MTAVGEYYRVLGVPSDAATEDIKKAFRKLARSCHPDVAGDDPASAAQFARIREAYETLVNDERRARYDRQLARPTRQRGKSHIRTHWRPPGGWDGFSNHRAARETGRPGHQKTDVTLDDMFSGASKATTDFGCGATKPTPGRRDDDADFGRVVDVPGRTARLGGTVTVRYNRLRRSSDGVNVYNYAEIHDLRVPPKTCTGDVLRSDRMGHFSKRTNVYADLVCRITVTEESGTHHPRRDTDPGTVRSGGSRTEAPSPAVGESSMASVRISIMEAVLGGRVQVPTPTGSVKVSIPPGTSSGRTLRLKNKGPDGGDWHVRVEIEVPRTIDDESRRLMERFAELNPLEPDAD